MLPLTKTPKKEELSDLTILIHGAPKLGKTTWASHAEGALFLACEPGLNSLEVFQVPITTWEDFLTACAEIAQGGHAYKTVVVDTIDNAIRLCETYICAKNKIEHVSDLAFGKAYSLVSSEIQRVFTKLAFLPYGLILIAHSQAIEIETRTGKYTRMVPAISEKARKLLLGMVDIIGYADLETGTTPDGKQAFRRVLRTKPHQNYEAGDRTGRLPEVIDLDYTKFLEAFNKPAAAQEASASRNQPVHAEAPGKKPVAAGK